MPQEWELGRVVHDRIGEDLRVGDLNHTSGALIAVHPIADLQQMEMQDRCIDHVAGMRSDLDAVADLEGRPAVAAPDVAEALQYRTLDRRVM